MRSTLWAIPRSSPALRPKKSATFPGWGVAGGGVDGGWYIAKCSFFDFRVCHRPFSIFSFSVLRANTLISYYNANAPLYFCQVKFSGEQGHSQVLFDRRPTNLSRHAFALLGPHVSISSNCLND